MSPESLLRKAQALGDDIKEMESIDETSDSSLHRCNVRRLKIKKKFGQRLSK